MHFAKRNITFAFLMWMLYSAILSVMLKDDTSINKNVFIIIKGHGVFHEHISSIVIPIVPQPVMARITKPVSMTGVDILN